VKGSLQFGGNLNRRVPGNVGDSRLQRKEKEKSKKASLAGLGVVLLGGVQRLLSWLKEGGRRRYFSKRRDFRIWLLRREGVPGGDE